MNEELTLESVRTLLPDRPESGHKGSFGHLFVLAGSRTFTGAAKLCAEAASRSGVGLVTLGIPYPLGSIVATGLLEVMCLRLPATESESFARDAIEPAIRFAAGKEAVVLGPGLSQHFETISFVHDFIRLHARPLLLDADALNAISDNPAILVEHQGGCLITPHPGEMARLLAISTAEVQADRAGCARAFAREHGVTVALKGHQTVVADPEGRIALNTTGNNGLGSGGTGDVLAGLIGGLLAQGLSPWDAARLGVCLHGHAGDLAAEAMSARGMIARDLIASLPQAWRAIERG